MVIEDIFRAGRYDGQDYDESWIDRVIKNFDPEYHLPPVVAGHENDDSKPALAWVKRLFRDGPVLKAEIDDIVPEAREAVREKKYRFKSAAFYKDLDGRGPALRHLAILGNAVPKVKGLGELSFKEGDYLVIEFQEQFYFLSSPIVGNRLMDGHRHTVTLDAEGNGETSTEEDHTHNVNNFEVQSTIHRIGDQEINHTHLLVGTFSEAEMNFQEGKSLRSVLNGRIKRLQSDKRSRADIVEAMGRAAGIDPNTVNEILNGSIKCPPLRRLRGFARALDMSANTLIAAARRGGCKYEETTNASEVIMPEGITEESLIRKITNAVTGAFKGKAFVFSDTSEPPVVNSGNAKMFTEEEVNRLVDKAAERIKADLETKFSEQVETQVARVKTDAQTQAKIDNFIHAREAEGNWIPAFDRMGLRVFMEDLAGTDGQIEFAEGKKVSRLDWFMDFMKKLPKIVEFEEMITGEDEEESELLAARRAAADFSIYKQPVDTGRLGMHQQILAFAEKNKLSYREAAKELSRSMAGR